MNECSFIVEFDEINDKQIDELWKYLLEKNIKFHVLKANDNFLKEQKYKEVIGKLEKYLRSNEYSKDYKYSNCRTTLSNILKEVE